MGPPSSGSEPARERVRTRLARVDWREVAGSLDARGYARIPGLLRAAECRALRSLWPERARFRSDVDMARHRFGEGAYRYFANPLPPLVRELRRQLYPPLARIANRWAEALGDDDARVPASLGAWLGRCHAGGQERPTPLLLRYETGGYNCLHQDLYGPLAFPLQVACLLSEPGRDFEGGEFLLVEQRPHMQSRGEALALRRGEAVVFPNSHRPVEGRRGPHRARLRHGVSTISRGERIALGIIFHDAR